MIINSLYILKTKLLCNDVCPIGFDRWRTNHNTIDKANEEYTKDDLIMAERKIKALKNSNFDLFYDEEKELHYRRLEDKYKSKWKGTTYFLTKKGAIYFISSQGKKIYIKKK